MPWFEPESAVSLIEPFKGQHVLVVGDVLLDRYWWGTVTRISPEAPVPVVLKNRSSIVPGGAANVAANIASLGGVPHLLGITGEDEPACQLRSALEERGIAADGLLADAHRPTTVKTRVVAHHQHVVRVDEEHTGALIGDFAAALLAKFVRALRYCRIVVLSDYAKGVLNEQTLPALIAAATAERRRLIVDPKGHDYRRYRGAYLLSPNRQEAFTAAAMADEGSQSVAQAVERIMEQVPIETLLVTQGEAGMSLFQRGKDTVHIPSVARSVFDVTGAGDTVTAALSLSLAAGVPLVAACHIASVAAGLAVEQVGTAAITFEQLRAELLDARHWAVLPPPVEQKAAFAGQD